MKFKGNKLITLYSEDLPKLCEELISKKSYLVVQETKNKGYVVWTETKHLKSTKLLWKEAVKLSAYLTCPICETVSPNLSYDYREINQVSSKYIDCFDCRHTPNKEFLEIKNMAAEEKREHVKGLVLKYLT